MEALSSIVFIGAVIVGVTELIKRLKNKDYDGAIVIAIAVAVGALVGIFDVDLGLTNITVAQGIMAGFGAVGTFQTARQIG